MNFVIANYLEIAFPTLTFSVGSWVNIDAVRDNLSSAYLRAVWPIMGCIRQLAHKPSKKLDLCIVQTRADAQKFGQHSYPDLEYYKM